MLLAGCSKSSNSSQAPSGSASAPSDSSSAAPSDTPPVAGSPAFTSYSIPTAAATPGEITTGPDGNLWFTEGDGNKIGQITPTGTVKEFTVPTAKSNLGGITTGPDGNLWFTEG